MAEAMGFGGVGTWLQSGNLVFEARRRATAGLEEGLENETEKAFGLQVHYMVRTSDEWAEIIARNPFPDAAKDDPGHLLVLALKRAPTKQDVAALRAAIKGRETLEAVGREVYVIYADGIGTSRLTNAVIEKTLGTRATGRNWNTVRKLAELMNS